MLPKRLDSSMTSRSLALALLLPLIATVVELVSGLDAVLVYDRDLAMGGEAWRFLTGHFVHATAQLFAYNTLATLALAIACERVIPGIAARAAFGALLTISFVALPLSPEIHQYDGLSAAASALGAAACIGLVIQAKARGEILPALLAFGVAIAFLAKLTYERFVGTAVFADTDTRPWAEAHLVGALIGGLLAARSKRPPRHENDSRSESHDSHGKNTLSSEIAS